MTKRMSTEAEPQQASHFEHLNWNKRHTTKGKSCVYCYLEPSVIHYPRSDVKGLGEGGWWSHDILLGKQLKKYQMV